MRRIVVNKNDAGQRLDKFLGKFLKSAPQSILYKWIRKKRVKVNGKKQDISYRLNEGDTLELYINDEFFNYVKPEEFKDITFDLDIAYEDDNILVVNKPSGLLAHGDEQSLLNFIRAYLYQKGDYDPEKELSFAPSLCHRIDRNTSGLVIAAKNAKSLREINEKIKNREIEKYYLCAVEGVPDPKEGVIEGYLIKDSQRNKMNIYNSPREGSVYSATKYKVLSVEADYSLVEARLVTGRTHQIRVHFLSIGHPLKGDVKYGAKKNGKRSYQDLRAYKIKFKFMDDTGSIGYLNGKTIEI